MKETAHGEVVPRVVLPSRQPPQLRETDPSIKRNFGDETPRHDLSWARGNSHGPTHAARRARLRRLERGGAAHSDSRDTSRHRHGAGGGLAAGTGLRRRVDRSPAPRRAAERAVLWRSAGAIASLSRRALPVGSVLQSFPGRNDGRLLPAERAGARRVPTQRILL